MHAPEIQIARLVSPAAALVLSLAVAATPVQAQTGAPETTRTGIGSLPAIDFRTPERAPSLGRLVTDLGADFRRLPSDRNLMVVVPGGSFGALFNHSDHEITGALRASPVEEMLDPGRHVGGAAFQLGAAALTYAVGHLASKPAVATLGADLVRQPALPERRRLRRRHWHRRRPDGDDRTGRHPVRPGPDSHQRRRGNQSGWDWEKVVATASPSCRD